MADNWISASLFGVVLVGLVFATVVVGPILFIIAVFIHMLATG